MQNNWNEWSNFKQPGQLEKPQNTANQQQSSFKDDTKNGNFLTTRNATSANSKERNNNLSISRYSVGQNQNEKYIKHKNGKNKNNDSDLSHSDSSDGDASLYRRNDNDVEQRPKSAYSNNFKVPSLPFEKLHQNMVSNKNVNKKIDELIGSKKRVEGEEIKRKKEKNAEIEKTKFEKEIARQQEIEQEKEMKRRDQERKEMERRINIKKEKERQQHLITKENERMKKEKERRVDLLLSEKKKMENDIDKEKRESETNKERKNEIKSTNGVVSKPEVETVKTKKLMKVNSEIENIKLERIKDKQEQNEKRDRLKNDAIYLGAVNKTPNQQLPQKTATSSSKYMSKFVSYDKPLNNENKDNDSAKSSYIHPSLVSSSGSSPHGGLRESPSGPPSQRNNPVQNIRGPHTGPPPRGVIIPGPPPKNLPYSGQAIGHPSPPSGQPPIYPMGFRPRGPPPSSRPPPPKGPPPNGLNPKLF